MYMGMETHRPFSACGSRSMYIGMDTHRPFSACSYRSMYMGMDTHRPCSACSSRSVYMDMNTHRPWWACRTQRTTLCAGPSFNFAWDRVSLSGHGSKSSSELACRFPGIPLSLPTSPLGMAKITNGCIWVSIFYTDAQALNSDRQAPTTNSLPSKPLPWPICVF